MKIVVKLGIYIIMWPFIAVLTNYHVSQRFFNQMVFDKMVFGQNTWNLFRIFAHKLWTQNFGPERWKKFARLLG